MEQIIKANDAILGILNQPKASDSSYRMLRYCLSTQVPEGTLLFNLLTRELLLLSPEEYANVLHLPELRQRWFVVPEQTQDKKLVEMVRWIQRSMKKQPKRTTAYTIMTTTDCNARCFYCYELGRSRIPMSEETALKVAAFIKENSKNKPVRLSWFGGEPLYNDKVIDLICDSLRADGVEFVSTMISNGYLFDDERLKKAVERWNLKQVQISLDGTEQVYNRCKDYIYPQGSAYQVVLNNISRLLDRRMVIFIRMNLDFHNTEDLLELAEELAARFGGNPRFIAYSHLIFDDSIAWDQRYSLEKWTQLYDAQSRLAQRLDELGIGISRMWRLRRKLPDHQCMADNAHSVVITPDGRLGKCEHYSESELIGHLDSPERDQQVIDSFLQRMDEIPACATCFYYPECVRLKKCPDQIPCIPAEQIARKRQIEQAMHNEYQLWKTGRADGIEDADEEIIDIP